LRFARRFAAGYFDSYRGLPATTWILCLAAFVNRAGAMVVPFLSIWLGQRYGYSVAEAGRLISLYGIGGILGSLAGGRLTDAFGPVRVQIVSLLGTGAWMLFMTTIEQQWVLAGSVLVLGLLNDAFRPGNQTAVGASCDAAVRPKALAMNRLALNAGWMIGPSVGGFLAKASLLLAGKLGKEIIILCGNDHHGAIPKVVTPGILAYIFGDGCIHHVRFLFLHFIPQEKFSNSIAAYAHPRRSKVG
jgi:predicted MFS family arabinose efflux permease